MGAIAWSDLEWWGYKGAGNTIVALTPIYSCVLLLTSIGFFIKHKAQIGWGLLLSFFGGAIISLIIAGAGI
jgi:hypothetical protein